MSNSVKSKNDGYPHTAKGPRCHPDIKPSLSHHDRAFVKIQLAIKNQIAWSEVTARDFAWYFVHHHNIAFASTPHVFDKYSTVAAFKSAVLDRYHGDVCDLPQFIRTFVAVAKSHEIKLTHGVTLGVLTRFPQFIESCIARTENEMAATKTEDVTQYATAQVGYF